MNRKNITILGLGHNFGDSRIYYKQALSLSKKFDVTCLWGFFSEEKGGKKDYNIYNYSFSGNRILILFKSVVYCFRNKSDIYVAHDIDSFIVLSMLKSIKWNSKIIFDSHEYYDEYSLSKFNLVGKIVLFLFRNFLKLIYIRFFKGVTVVTGDMKNYYPKTISTSVIYNYPIFSKLENVQSNNKLDSKYKYLLYHGGISKDRGIYEIIKIFSKLYEVDSDFRLLLIGKFSSEELKDNIYNIIEDNGVKDGITITGKLSYNDTLSYISNDVKFVGLCLFENNFQHSYGVPIKMFEYLYYNIPQLGCKHMNNYDNIIYKNRAGDIVQYGDIEASVKMIKKIYNNYDEYVTNCKKIKNNYSWEKEETKLLEFYLNL